MINALKPHYREFGRGALIVDEKTQTKQYFKFAIVSDKEKQWNTPIKNLITSQENLVIKTSWDLPFDDNMRVLLQGEPYLIIRCKPITSDINEQSLGLLKSTFSAYWVLELTR